MTTCTFQGCLLIHSASICHGFHTPVETDSECSCPQARTSAQVCWSPQHTLNHNMLTLSFEDRPSSLPPCLYSTAQRWASWVHQARVTAQALVIQQWAKFLFSWHVCSKVRRKILNTHTHAHTDTQSLMKKLKQGKETESWVLSFFHLSS